MVKLIFGAFTKLRVVDQAIMDLEEAGVSREDFSVIARRELLTSAASEVSGKEHAKSGTTTGGLETLVYGVVTTAGMFVTGPVALLAGLGRMPLAAVASGPVDTLAEGLRGALAGLGVSQGTARQQASAVTTGGLLLGVEDKAVSEQEVRICFEQYGVEHVSVIEYTALPG